MRILLIEDDRQHAAIIARSLRKHAFAVDVAADGEEGLFLAETNTYAVIVLDVMLPKRTGIEVCRTLRKSGSDVPVLMLTARDAIEDRITGLETGADDYLTKPFAFDEFVARVRALLRRVRRYEAPVLAVGDLTIDTAARSARRGERDIPLTSKEFALLEFLARNAGRVVGRAEISEHVWDNSYEGLLLTNWLRAIPAFSSFASCWLLHWSSEAIRGSKWRSSGGLFDRQRLRLLASKPADTGLDQAWRGYEHRCPRDRLDALPRGAEV